MTLKAPFPWFGGKSRAAPMIWARLGDCRNYIEPFAGSLAVLLGRPTPPGVETVNDLDGFVANFWRALAWHPAELERLVDWPVNEADLHARHLALVACRADLTAHLMGDARWCDVGMAAWWVWGISAWIGGGWCSGTGPWVSADGRMIEGDAGQGVNRRWACADLHARLRGVRVACGDWSRICGPSVTRVGSPCGIVLDPPYDDGCDVYAAQNRVSADVREWAKEAGKDRCNRIALCGYSGDHDELLSHGWDVEDWRANGGYGNRSDKDGRANAKRERIWFSPGCLPRKQPTLF